MLGRHKTYKFDSTLMLAVVIVMIKRIRVHIRKSENLYRDKMFYRWDLTNVKLKQKKNEVLFLVGEQQWENSFSLVIYFLSNY